MNDFALFLIIFCIAGVISYFLSRLARKKREYYNNDATSIGILVFIFSFLVIVVAEILILFSRVRC
jgi:predicted PurR-regulated permease PerM